LSPASTMYAPPPAVVAPAPRRSGLAAGGPLLAICCLLFILFLIASTIVLALIPVYVQRDIDPVGNSPRYTAVMTPQGRDDVPEGNFDQNSLNNFNAASDSAVGLNSGAFNADSSTSTQGAGKRKRRGFGLVRERRASGISYCKFRFNRRRCSICGTRNFLRRVIQYTITIVITILPVGGGAATFVLQTVTFLVRIFFGDLTVPPFLGSGSTVTGRLAG